MLPFVPRKVAQASKPTSGTGSTSQPKRIASVPASSSVRLVTHTESQSTDVKGKGKATDVAEEIHTLLCLALSDNAIWADPHLKSRVVNGSDGCRSYSD